MTKTAVIVDAVRTPIGAYAGGLKDVRPDDLVAHVLRALLARNPGVDPASIEDVYMGCANQAGEDNRNVARMAVLLSGLPEHVGGVTFNRLCASGLEAFNMAAQSIELDRGDVFVAGGVESMTRAPLVMGKPPAAFPRGNIEMFDTTLGWRFVNPKMLPVHAAVSMGMTAENVAVKYGVTRQEQDELALESQRRWAEANRAGRFKDEIAPVSIPRTKADPLIVDTDEHPRPDTTMEKLAKLKPAFKEGGVVTAGNASGINDGAAAILVMSEQKATELGVTPIARFVTCASAGVNADYMGIGPIPATRKALKRAGLQMGDIGLIELNEAFAAQAVACMRELGIDPSICNVNGGAIALGHPLGCTGARLLTTLVHEMRRRPSVRYGLATLCVGVGQGVATIVERVGPIQ
ncbi:MAG: acetyl-CoA C-acyltransferase [Acidobacteriota bacterium]